MLKSIFCPEDLSNVRAISHGKGKEKVARTIYARKRWTPLSQTSCYFKIIGHNSALCIIVNHREAFLEVAAKFEHF